MKTTPLLTTEGFLTSIKSELEQTFASRPEYGVTGIMCHFHNGTLVRVEVTRSTLKKVPENQRSNESES